MTVSETSAPIEQDKGDDEPETQDHPRLELTTPIQVDESNPEWVVVIGSELKGKVRRQLIRFLKANKSTFARTTEDMLGIDVSITSHQLNFDPSFKPVKQKRHKLSPNRAKAVLMK